MPVIQMFAKPPVPGRVKTRLIPDIGEANATRVFQHCLNYTMTLIKNSSFDYQIWLSEDSQHPTFQDESYKLQQGDDLGERMLSAIESEFSNLPDHPVVLIGSDCLDLNQQHFEEAFAALAANDIVLLPTLDGGFALIGCRITNPDIFNRVEWSSSHVLQQTISNAESLNYRVHLLDTVRDIDTVSDLSHYPELLSIIEPAE